jgi:hypothetical protein
MRKTFKKRINKRTLKKRKNIKRIRTRRGGMLASRISQSIFKHAEPHIERKTKEWGRDILEAKIKKSDIYKDTNNHIQTGLIKTLTSGSELINNENFNPNSLNKIYSMPTQLAMPSSVVLKNSPISSSSSKNFLNAINHPLSNTYNIKQNI